MPGMHKRITTLAALCLLTTAGLCLATAPMREAARGNAPDSPEETAASSAAREGEGGGRADCRPLFPALESGYIEQVWIDTPYQTFRFRREEEGERVSVNGHKADGEVFDTLVEQILSCSFEPGEPFAERAEPVLTLAVSARQARYSARFYPGDGTDKRVHVISEFEDEPQYLTTEAWRVGTLLLTCEGTRIFDENGEEIPAW